MPVEAVSGHVKLVNARDNEIQAARNTQPLQFKNRKCMCDRLNESVSHGRLGMLHAREELGYADFQVVSPLHDLKCKLQLAVQPGVNCCRIEYPNGVLNSGCLD